MAAGPMIRLGRLGAGKEKDVSEELLVVADGAGSLAAGITNALLEEVAIASESRFLLAGGAGSTN